MFSQRTDYDRGVNTFSPEGRLLQVEYAIEAIKLGSSAVGIKVNEGVVLAAERRILSAALMEPKKIEKIFEIDTHIACAASGLVTDARTLVEFARVEAQNHSFVFNEPISVRALAQGVSDLALEFGESDGNKKKKKKMSRPYGVALLIAGVDENGPNLYHTDPSGTMIQFEARGIGAADEGIQSLLREKYNGTMTLENTEKLALDCLKQVMEEKINKDNVELWVIPAASKRIETRDAEYVENILKTLK